MKKKQTKEASLIEFFEQTSVPKEELEGILEMQKIVEEILESEDKPQVYQLQVTSNW